MNLVLAASLLTILAITTVTISSANHVNSTKSAGAVSDETEKTWKSEGSVCPHKDYRSYVKCLQNHRRREVQSQATSTRGTVHGGSVNCVEECERESCRQEGTGPCTDVCYDRCLKKTKEIHHRITEYESTCGEGEDCDNGRKSGQGRGFAGIANLTTSIDIRNYLNNTNVIVTHPQYDRDGGNHLDKDEGAGGDRKDLEARDVARNNTNCKNGQGCGGNGNKDGNRGPPPPRGPPPGFQPWYPAPSLTLIPQIQMVPQVTFGLGISSGFGSGTGCPYASVWLCFPQQQQQQPQVQQIRDCSGCEQPYPYQRGRCDPTC